MRKVLVSRSRLNLVFGFSLAFACLPLGAQPQLTVTRPDRFAISPRLSDLPHTPGPPFRDHPPIPLPSRRPGGSTPQSDPAVQSNEQRLAIDAAMAQLPDDQRLVVGLVLVEGFSYKEAAEVLEVPMGTLTSRLARARATLVELLGDSADTAS